MNRFDDELRRATRPLASEPLPPDVLDEALDEPPRNPAWAFMAAAGAVLVLAIGAGIGVARLLPTAESPEPSASIGPSPSQGGEAGCENVAPSLPVGNDTVLLYFPCGRGGEPMSTIRTVGLDTTTTERLTVAIRALLEGPNEIETDAGAVPIIPTPLPDLLAGVELASDGLAIIDFHPELAEINNLSTSAASGAFLRSLRETALRFEQVTGLELRMGGSCDALFEHLQSQCQHFAKTVVPVSDCPIIAPAVLPSGAPITAPRPYPNQPMVSWGSGQDTVTQLPGIRPAGGEMGPAPHVDVRGHPGWVQPSGDLPLPQPFEIVWDEDGCRYVVFVALDGGEEAVLEYANRYGSAVAEASPSPRTSLPSTVEADGIRLALELDRDSTSYGERVTATVTIENIGADSVFWGHSGTCVFPATVTVYPVERERLRFGRTDWAGDIGILKSVTVEERLSSADLTHEFWPEGWLDFDGNMGCTSDLRISELAAGDTLLQRLEWDAYGYYGMPATPGAYSLEGTFNFMSRGAAPSADESIDEFTVRVGGQLAIEGEDLGYVHPGEAFDALLDDPGYRDLLTDAPRGLWVESDLDFIGGRWEAVLYLSASDAEVQPVRALVGVVDALTGEVLSVSFEQRTRPGDG